MTRDKPEKRDVCVLLLSPLNSSFTEENISKSVKYARLKHPDSHIVFMIADKPLEMNFMAIGYPNWFTAEDDVKSEDRAEARARKYVNQLRNKAKRAAPDVPLISFSEHLLQPGTDDAEEHIIRPYRGYYAVASSILHHLFEVNMKFQADVQETSMPVIEKYAQQFNKKLLPENMPEVFGCCYLLEELAAFMVMPRLLQDTLQIAPSEIGDITCVYPNDWPIFKNFFDGKYGNPAGCVEIPEKTIANYSPGFPNDDPRPFSAYMKDAIPKSTPMRFERAAIEVAI